MANNKALILLQENSGRLPFDDSLPSVLRGPIAAMVDAIAETFEDLKTKLQAQGHYDVTYLLTDDACSRAKLLEALVTETKKGRTIDLMVIGHGSPESLILKKSPHLTGRQNGTIRSLLPDAKKAGVSKLNLRMVYMCNCHGSTLNDDWLAVGAKVSIGSRQLDMMPEPMTTLFMQFWVGGRSAKDAAKLAYQSTIPHFLPFYPPTPRVKMKTIPVPYPCPTFSNPFKICHKNVQVPAGVEFIPHSYVTQTELIVAGDGNQRH